MATNQDSIRHFLLASAMNARMVPAMVRDFASFCDAITAGNLPAIAPKPITSSAIAKAIRLATKTEVDRVIFISKNTDLPIDLGLRAMAEFELGTETGYSLADLLREAHSKTVAGFASERMMTSSFRFLHERIYDHKNCSLRKSLGNSLYYSFVTNFNFSHCYYLYFGLEGRRVELAQLRPLVKLLPYALPLGTIKGCPGVWKVLIA